MDRSDARIAAPDSEMKQMTEPQEAILRLRQGNERFVEKMSGGGDSVAGSPQLTMPHEQEPFAVILGCSDSRVPAEIVFDQGLGDLFVVRVAGNVVAPSQIGSVEFAAAQFGIKLVVVMGHTQCGAVMAALGEMQQPMEEQSINLRSIVDRVRPCVEPLLHTELRNDKGLLMAAAVRANIQMSVDHLQHGSSILEAQVRDGSLLVVGAEYAVETGTVEFFV